MRTVTSGLLLAAIFLIQGPPSSVKTVVGHLGRNFETDSEVYPASATMLLLSKPDAATQAQVSETFGKLPLSFEANQGQSGKQVKFLSRGPGYSLFLTPTEAVLVITRPPAHL